MTSFNFSKSIGGSILYLLLLFSNNGLGQTAPNSKCAEYDYDAQIVEANKGINFSPYNIQAFLNRGYAYLRKIEYDKALADFNRAIEINPNSEKAFYYRGLLYASRANYDQSIADLTTAIEINQDFVEAYYLRGRSYFYKNEDNPAMADFNKAIILNPKLAENYYGRAAQHQKAGKKQESANDYNKAIELIGREIELNFNGCNYAKYLLRGVVYSALNNPRQAMVDYNKSIIIKQNEENYYYRGLLHSDNKNYKLAVTDFTKAIELNLQFAESYKERAISYEKLGEKEKAASDRQKYKELSEKKFSP